MLLITVQKYTQFHIFYHFFPLFDKPLFVLCNSTRYDIHRRSKPASSRTLPLPGLKTAPRKIALVTGATDGIGLETALRLALMGYAVWCSGRSQEKAAQAARQIRAACGHPEVYGLHADHASMQELERLVQDVQQNVTHLDVLIHNAGAVFPHFQTNTEGIEMTFAVNHLAPFYLSARLLPLLEAAPAARMVVVSSGSHWPARICPESFTAPVRYNLLKAYGQSKLANLLFTFALAEKLKKRGSPVTVNALCPGRIRTRIGNKNQPWYLSMGWSLLTRLSGGSVEKGARTPVWLATAAALEGVSGKYFKNERVAASSPRSLHPESGAALWASSESFTNLKFL